MKLENPGILPRIPGVSSPSFKGDDRPCSRSSSKWTIRNYELFFLVVSTHLKNISPIGSFPQLGVKIKHIWNHHPVFFLVVNNKHLTWFLKKCLWPSNDSFTGTSSLVVCPWCRLSKIPGMYINKMRHLKKWHTLQKTVQSSPIALLSQKEFPYHWFQITIKQGSITFFVAPNQPPTSQWCMPISLIRFLMKQKDVYTWWWQWSW